MFNCPKCSAEVRYGAKFCDSCGCEMNWDSVNNQANAGSAQNQSVAGSNAKWSVLAIVGFALSLFGGGLISLVLSIIGMKECKEKGYQGKPLAIIGIVLSAISTIVAIIGIIIYIVMIVVFAGEGYFFYS